MPPVRSNSRARDSSRSCNQLHHIRTRSGTRYFSRDQGSHTVRLSGPSTTLSALFGGARRVSRSRSRTRWGRHVGEGGREEHGGHRQEMPPSEYTPHPSQIDVDMEEAIRRSLTEAKTAPSASGTRTDGDVIMSDPCGAGPYSQPNDEQLDADIAQAIQLSLNENSAPVLYDHPMGDPAPPPPPPHSRIHLSRAGQGLTLSECIGQGVSQAHARIQSVKRIRIAEFLAQSRRQRVGQMARRSSHTTQRQLQRTQTPSLQHSNPHSTPTRSHSRRRRSQVARAQRLTISAYMAQGGRRERTRTRSVERITVTEFLVEKRRERGDDGMRYRS